MALTEFVESKALAYMNETDFESNEPLLSFPTSIVEFVLEFAQECCHFPDYFTDEKIEKILKKHINTLCMMCVEVYTKVGSEGQTAYTSNGVQRIYKSEWISTSLIDKLPNYVSSL